MKATVKKDVIFIFMTLMFFCSTHSFAVNNDQPLELESGHLNQIINNSQIISTLLVEYQICSYDYTNNKIKAWICNKPQNNVAVIPQNSMFSIFVPNNRVDKNGNVQVEYAVQVFAVTNMATKEEVRKGFSSICRTTKDKNTLRLTDNPRNNSDDKIKCL